ncbi:lantibiotic dehydratase [Paenibacillus macerans]|uniref:lantibiotic dehydratase n=1 Tax=Paenibacillus macerans TaxID=44252 RepID=UPI00203C3953|nr:lantibiotic dehydratase [Paenibacillus macerans]MCM3699013.1 lantibiotic dehydratase [Paenibacillus macerans]
MRNLYQACDFFMLRTPLLPVEFYKEICFLDDSTSQEELSNILKIKEIREAIQVGSPSLYRHLESMNDKVSSSVMKYLIRMSTRTTPFGLFSGVSIGTFNSYTCIELNDKKNFKKRLRPDMEWLYGVIKLIESNPKLIKSMKVKRNAMVYKKGDRLENPYVSNLGMFGKIDGEIATSIRWTNVLDLIMDNTQEFIEVNKLQELLSVKYSHVKEEKITNYIQELIRYEYLITSLRPPLTNVDLFKYVIMQVKELENADEQCAQLEAIDHMIDVYNTQAVGDGQKTLSDITRQMSNLFENTSYLQIDMAISTNKNVLHQCIAQDIGKYCEMLRKLAVSEVEDSNLKAYKEEFIEKYGLDTEVQVLELLDEGIGLGAPAGYLNPLSYRKYEPEIPNEKVKKIKQFLQYKIVENNTIHNESIELTDDDIEKMIGENEVPMEEFAPSVEFNAIISAKSSEDVDKGEYLLFIGPNFGSFKAGKTFGRFMDILDDRDARIMANEIYEKEKEILDEYIMVELSELLQYGRGNNVTINSNNLEYQLCIATNSMSTQKTIDIQDVYIGVHNNKFYVKSKSLNKKLYITYHHMMNHRNGSNLGRFLKDITLSYHTNLMDTAFLFLIDNFGHIPRVMYKNIVIIPATWKIKKEQFNLGSYEKFVESFTNWVNTNNVTRYVYQKESDNRLMLDLASPVHTKELFQILKKSATEVILTETEAGSHMDRFIVNDQYGKHYCCEIVIPLIRKRVMSETVKKDDFIVESLLTKSKIERNRNEVSIQDEKRNLFPGGENWYYYKLYVTGIRMNELIGDYIYDFCESLIREGMISKYFFVRYADPKVHLRLRLQVTDHCDYLVQQQFNQFLKRVHEKGLVNSVQMENYVRELERYGGYEVISEAEDYFFADSQYVGQLIKLHREKQINHSDEHLGIVSIISIMEHFRLPFEDQERLFCSVIERNQNRDYYKKNRRELMQIANWEQFGKRGNNGNILLDLISKKRDKTIKYRMAIDQLDQQGKLCNSKKSILLALIHMFCNRFKGDNEWERLIMALINHSLYDLKLYKASQMKRVVVNSND